MYVSTSLSSLNSLNIHAHIHTLNLTENICYTHTREHLLYNHCHCQVDKNTKFFFLFFVKFVVSTLLVQNCVVLSWN